MSLVCSVFFTCFFFFQAEDGIRDRNVTGVQTCALPICTTTVVVYTTPFWIKARLDEVVVDHSARGKGVGEARVKVALQIGRDRGAQVAELQSGHGPAREAAHRLYERLGFKIRETDVFRSALE